MKIICECGCTLKLVETESYEDGKTTYCNTVGNIDVIAGHDEVWFTCNECQKSILVLT